ncbi:MAG: silent information regulator protein Sir2, partial [Armatimonadota bacterium]|nr:silent information regulator protein Sir2 [Armatimonadota bacterium]
VFYGIEPRRKRDGICLVDARTGQIIWGWDKPTEHIHDQGMAADIDPNHQGMECFAGERDFPEQRWLLSAKGEILLEGKIPTLSPKGVWWDDNPQKEILIGRRLIHWAKQKDLLVVEGNLLGIADIIGDWREEIITCVEGELRIYTTTIPTDRRHICLMQDRQYRLGVAAMSMGYLCPPQLSKFGL